MSSRAHFDADRKAAAASFDTLAEDYYRDYWDVQQIRDIEGDAGGEYPRDDDAKTTLQLLDCAGMDTLVYAETDHGAQYIAIGEKFRPPRTGSDFNPRVENNSTVTAELPRNRAGFRNYGFFPDVYAFGNHDGSEFVDFHLIDYRATLLAIEMGEVEPAPVPTGDGTTAGYIEVDALDRAGCLLESWEGDA